MTHDASSMKWLSMRGICVLKLQMKVDAWQVPGHDLSLLRTIELLHIGHNGCSSVTDQCLMVIATRCPKLRSICLRRCIKVTDAGISALGEGCGQLQSINLDGCNKVTDVGISVLSAGCG